jgi:hypothetical protein
MLSNQATSSAKLLCCVIFLLTSPAGFLDWGWQAGCDFVGKTCAAYAAAHPGQQFFCSREQYSSDAVNTVCTFDGLARAQCAEAPFAEGCAMKVGAGKECCLSLVFVCGWQHHGQLPAMQQLLSRRAQHHPSSQHDLTLNRFFSAAAAPAAYLALLRLRLAPCQTASHPSSPTAAAASSAGEMAPAVAACLSLGPLKPRKPSSPMLLASTAQQSKTAGATRPPAQPRTSCSCPSWVTRSTALLAKPLTWRKPCLGFSLRVQSGHALTMRRLAGHLLAGRAARVTGCVWLESATAA